MRAGLRAGQWGGQLPGAIPLSVELHVSPPAVRAALRQFEAEGFLKARGLGRCRRLADGPPKADRRRPRVMTTLAFLAERGQRAPERVSLVAMQTDCSLGGQPDYPGISIDTGRRA